jgi:beta-xylosidase
MRWKRALLSFMRPLAVASVCLGLFSETPKNVARYSNPVLFADYSDPDVIRDGKDYYLIASSFHFVPAIPILHSLDLVHWEIAGHVLEQLNLGPQYNMDGGTRYGGGVWAPSVRFHNGLFYLYFPTPDEGIFVTTAAKMTGPWSSPTAVIAGPGWEDPCPFWDDDGRAYLVHSKLGAGPLILHRMAPDGKSVLDAGMVIVQDAKKLPTLEGPKMYKRDGWYYIFAPMGGVGAGSQAVLRARNIYGPYDSRIVLEQGETRINGPHQGAYVETPDGRGWFIHFHLQGAHGRIVFLEPVRWQDGWPVIGEAMPGLTVGQPVSDGPLPELIAGAFRTMPETSDDFDAKTLSPMWEWNHNPDNRHWSLAERPGYMRLYPMRAADLLHARNTLTECMQSPSMEFTARLDLGHMGDGDRTGLSMFDKDQSYIAIQQDHGVREILFSLKHRDTVGPILRSPIIEVRVRVHDETASYFYSTDNGATFQPLGEPVKLTFSWWKGARPAVFAFNTGSESAKSSHIDIDWTHYRSQ